MRARWLLTAGAGLVLLEACAAPKPPPPPPAAPPPAAAEPAPPEPAPPESAAPKPQSVFVLLPDPSGQTGQITVSNRGGTQTLDQPRQASRVGSADEAPSPPVALDEPEVRRLVGEALEAQPPEPARFILYFKLNSDEIMPDSLARLADVLRSIRERRTADVTLAGHTDTMGERAYNYRLGLRRAVKVADLLASRGVDRGALDVSSHGEDDPVVKTGDEVPEPRNRRVEITVR